MQKSRHGYPATLDEHASQPAGRERLQHRTCHEPLPFPRQSQLVHVGALRLARGRVVPGQRPDSARRAVHEHVPAGRNSATRVEHHSNRTLASAGSYGQPRVIGQDSVRADHHRVGERTQPMEMFPVLRTSDVHGVPGTRRDAAIQALPQLGERAALPGQAQWYIQFRQPIRLGRSHPIPPPSAVVVKDEAGARRVALGPDAEQSPPRFGGVEHGGFLS